jgi:hypothetical protein
MGLDIDSAKFCRLHAFNVSLLSLILDAYSRDLSFQDNRIFVNGNHPVRSKEGIEKFFEKYCYELTLPISSHDRMLIYYQEDLKRYFNISCSKEKRKMKCLVLTLNKVAKHDSLYKTENLDIEKETLKKFIYNYTPSFVVNLLNRESDIPIVNETNYNLPFCIDLPFDLMDIPKLKSAFSNAGFTLGEEERELEVFVISDK